MRKWFSAFCLLLGAAFASSAGPVQAQSTICDTGYRPVCGIHSDGRREDYSNACWANGAGAILILPGRCSTQSQQRQSNRRVACPTIYKPVCGTMPNGQRRTFSNACVAHVAGAINMTPGRCDAAPRAEGLPLPWPIPWRQTGTASAPQPRAVQSARVRIMPGAF